MKRHLELDVQAFPYTSYFTFVTHSSLILWGSNSNLCFVDIKLYRPPPIRVDNECNVPKGEFILAALTSVLPNVSIAATRGIRKSRKAILSGLTPLSNAVFTIFSIK